MYPQSGEMILNILAINIALFTNYRPEYQGFRLVPFQAFLKVKRSGACAVNTVTFSSKQIF